MKILMLCAIAIAACLAEPPVNNRYLPPQQGFGGRTPSQAYGAPEASGFSGQRQTDAVFGARARPSSTYGAPSNRANRPSAQYGAPRSNSQAPSNQYLPARNPSSQYGPPRTSNFQAPSSQYGAPSSNNFQAPSSNNFRSSSSQYNAPSSNNFQAPSSQYGAPSSNDFQARSSNNFQAPSSQYGAPSAQSLQAPSSQYGAPQRFQSSNDLSSSQFGPPSAQYGAPNARNGPSQQYGTPAFGGNQQYSQSGQGGSSFRGNDRSYLPPGRGGYAGADGDDANSEPANYSFEYMVKDEPSGNDFGHRESRQGDRAEGLYYVLLPDGRKQTVEYEADENGYKPRISYEDTGLGSSGAGYDGNGQAGYQDHQGQGY